MNYIINMRNLREDAEYTQRYWLIRLVHHNRCILDMKEALMKCQYII